VPALLKFLNRQINYIFSYFKVSLLIFFCPKAGTVKRHSEAASEPERPKMN
jgi:hypothetical protein